MPPTKCLSSLGVLPLESMAAIDKSLLYYNLKHGRAPYVLIGQASTSAAKHLKFALYGKYKRVFELV